MVFGAEIKKQNGENVESRISRNIDNNGFYLQNVLNFWDGAVLTGGFRHDMNSAFIDKTTYKVEGAYTFKEYGTRIHSAHATGFRVPTMNDLFFPGFSNPNLKPEESNSVEVGIDQALFTDRLKAGITFFDSNLDNLIQFDSATFMPQNIGKATSRGTESYLKIQPIKELGVSLNHTWNDALDGDGHPLRRRTPNKFTTLVHHNWQDQLSSLIGVTYRRGIKDGRYNTEDFAVVRAAISYQIHKNIKLTLRGENLFNEKYEEIPGFGTAGVAGYAGLIGNF
jgi:vitamin B12 transporter